MSDEMERKQSASIATIMSYPFGAAWGWVLHYFGYPLWGALVIATAAGVLSNAISKVLWRREMRKLSARHVVKKETT